MHISLMHILKNMCALAVPNVLAITALPFFFFFGRAQVEHWGVPAGYQSLVLREYIQYGEQYVVVSCCIKN